MYRTLSMVAFILAQSSLIGQARAEVYVAEDADGVKISATMLRNELSRLSPEDQTRAKNDPAIVEKALKRLFNIEKVLLAAEREKIEEDPLVQYRLRQARAGELIRIMRERVEAKPVPDLQEQAEEYYRTHPEEFVQKETVKASHILLKAHKPEEFAARRKEMEKIQAELAGGADFAELAKRYSEDEGSARRGGELGQFPRGKMVKPFDDAVFGLPEVGAVSGVVETQFGLHLIKLTGREPERTVPFDEVKEQVMAPLEQKYKRQMVSAWWEEVTKPNDLKVDAEALKEFVPDAGKGVPPAAASNEKPPVASEKHD